MKRNRRVVFLAHCLLNSNAKVDGLSLYPGVLKSAVESYINDGIGIIQLPCPEITYGGLKRWGQCRDQYDHPKFRKHCREILEPYVDQMAEYLKCGYNIEGIVGIDRSPNCGVNLTCCGYTGGEIFSEEKIKENISNFQEVKGSGIFMEELAGMKIYITYDGCPF